MQAIERIRLPKPDTHCFDTDTDTDVWSYSPELVRETVLAHIDKLEAEVERLRKDAERNPMHEGEIQAAWLGHGIEEPMPYTFELGIRSAERFNGIKETP